MDAEQDLLRSVVFKCVDMVQNWEAISPTSVRMCAIDDRLRDEKQLIL